MTTRETYDDIFKQQGDTVIINLVNVLGFGSTGLSGKVRKEFPEKFEEYRKLCGWFKDKKHQHELIGTFQGIKLNNNLVLCNAFAQEFISETKFKINQDAWKAILIKVKRQVLAQQKRTMADIGIAVPYKISSNIKQEEAQVLRDTIKEIFGDTNLVITYYR